MSYIEIQPTFSHLSPNSSIVSPAIRKLWVRVPLGNSDIFLSKNSSNNIVITKFILCYVELMDNFKIDDCFFFQGMTGEGWIWLGSDKVTATSFRNEPTLQRAMEGLVGLTAKCECTILYCVVITYNVQPFPYVIHNCDFLNENLILQNNSIFF